MACLNCLAESSAGANFCAQCGVKLAGSTLPAQANRRPSAREGPPDVLWSMDGDGRFTYVSPSVERVFGFSRESCIGKSVLDPSDRAPGITADTFRSWAEQIQKARASASEQVVFEAELENAEGVLIPVEVNAVVARSRAGEILQVQGVVREVSERNRALVAADREAEVERIVAQIAASFINVPTSEIDAAIDAALAAVGHFAGVDSATIMLAEPEGDAFRLAYGWNRDGFVPAFDHGQRFRVSDLPWMHARLRAGETIAAESLDDLPLEAARERMLMESAGLSPLIVTPLVTAGQLCGYAALSMSGHLPAWTPQTLGLMRFVGDVVVNVVERKRASEVASRLESDLRQAQKMEAVGTLAGGIAHDFNNLLTSILGGIEFGLLDLPAESEAAEGLRVAQEAAERAAELTSRMLSLSSPQVTDMRSIDLNAVVARTVGFLRRSIPEHVRIEVATDPAIPAIRADAGQLGQALLNLVINARDSMPKGGEIRIATRLERRDALGTGESKEVACIRVVDDGEGIAPDALLHIFEPFFTTKSIGKGTGLGLSMAYGSVRAHGGVLTVESEVGRGSTFEILLPIETSSVADGVAPDRTEILPGTETILLVDDMDTVREIARGMLERVGYEVISAASCDEALLHFDRAAGRISVVVTDLIMPGGSGRDLLQAIRSRDAGVPIVLTSGYLADTSRAEIEGEGFACLVAKPFSRRTLALALQKTLEDARARAVAKPSA